MCALVTGVQTCALPISIPHTKRATGNPTLPPNAHIIDTASGSKALSPRATSHFRHRQALSILKSRRVKAIGMQIPTHSQRPPIPHILPRTLIGRPPEPHMERSEEHTSERQRLMLNTSPVLCLNTQKHLIHTEKTTHKKP